MRAQLPRFVSSCVFRRGVRLRKTAASPKGNRSFHYTDQLLAGQGERCYVSATSWSTPSARCRPPLPGPTGPIGGGTRLLRGRSGSLQAAAEQGFRKPPQLQLRRLFSFSGAMRGSQPGLRHGCRPDDRRAAPRTRRGRGAADLVELRLDHARPAGCRCRASPAGAGRSSSPAAPRGRADSSDGSEDERRRILESAIDAGAEFVDVEAAAAFAPDIMRRARGRGVVLSAHYLRRRPSGSAAARRRDARGGRRSRQAGRRSPHAQPTCCRCLRWLTPGARPSTRAHRHGGRRSGVAHPRGTARQPLDLRRRRRGTGTAAGRAARCASSVSAAFQPDCRPLRRRRQPGRALAVAGDAQRRVRGAGTERGLRAVRGFADADGFRSLRAGGADQRREHHRAVQGRI